MSQSQSTSNHNIGQSYVAAVKTVPQTTTPTKKQAIVMHAVESLKLFDYIKALSEIVGPKNILFASKISNQRICIYLSNIEIVDDLIKTYDKITIGDIEIPIRRLINPAKRIIISNVCPHIPNNIVESALKNLGLKLASPVSHLRAGFPGNEFAHILSFRRQVYISPIQDNNSPLPSTLLISYEDTEYRIFLSDDNMVCFICKEKGHLASNCPNTTQSHTDLSIEKEVPKKRPAASSIVTTPSEDTEANPLKSIDDDSTSIQEHEFVVPSQQNQTKSKPVTGPPKKKLKSTTESSSKYNTLEEIFESSPQNYAISYVNFKSFLDNCHGNSNPLTEARRYTHDIESILDTIHKVYSQLNDRTLRNRFTRLSKKIKRQLEEEGIETASFISLTSCTSQGSLTDTDIDQDPISQT